MHDYQPISDQQLIGQVYPMVLRVVRGRSYDRALVEDLAQEAMVRIIQRSGDWRGDGPVEHWAARIAVTVCIDAARRRQRRPELRYDDLAPAEREALESAVGAREPVDVVAGTDLVDRLLDSLPVRDRLVVHLLDVEERSVAEVAAYTGATAIGVRVRAFRARRRLRSLLGHLHEEHGYGS